MDNNPQPSLTPAQTIPVSQPEYAGFGLRFLAYWVDFLLLFPLGLLIQQMVGNNPFALFQAKTLEDLQKLQSSPNSLLAIVIGLAFGLAYFLIFWVKYDGATPGKKLLGIKIIKDTGEKLSYPVAFIRYIGFLISSALVSFFALGFLWIIWDKKKQALHDKIAGTLVVKTGQPSRVILGILLTILAIFLITGYMTAAIIKGFQLGMQEASKKNMGSIASQSINQNKVNMLPEAKIHYDKSQQLFKQMQAVKDNPAAIKPLADQTIKEAKLATDIQPNNALLLSNLGDAYGWPNTIGTAEDSLNAYKKAEALDPTNFLYIDYVGDQLIKMGRNEEAILQLQKTFRLGTDNDGYAHVSIGRAYKNLGVYGEAKKNFQRGIEIFQSENTNGKFDAQILDAQKELANLPN